MIWLQFVAIALVIVVAGARLARYGDVLGEKIGLGRTWIGVALLAATTSLPELFTGFGATALSHLPDIAVGDVLGSCMFNLLILSMMDVLQPEPLSTRAHQGHVLSIGLGLVLVSIAGLGIAGRGHIPVVGWMGAASALLIVGYFVSMRAVFIDQQHRRAREVREVAEKHMYDAISIRSAVVHYVLAAVFVVGAALWLPGLGAGLAQETGLGNTFIGSLLVAITTSLPELVVSIAAVRIGAIDLGIGNVLGSNLFNFMILGLDDAWYRPGPLLAAVNPSHLVVVLAVVAMNALFLVGLTTRVVTKRFAIAWDTAAMAVVYLAAIALTFMLGA